MLKSIQVFALTVVIGIFFSIPLSSQKFIGARYDRLSTHEGLSSNWVNQTIQDNLGYIYFATTSGLDRYDGTNIKHYTQNEKPGSLSHNHVTCLLLDNKNRLWVGTDNGLNLKKEDDTFISFLPDSNDYTSILCNNIETLFEDSKGRIWIGTQSGLSLYDEENKTFRNFIYDPEDNSSIALHSVRTVYEDKNNLLWVSTWKGGISILDTREISSQENLKFRRLNHRTIHELRNSCFNHFFEDKKGRLWGHTYNGSLYRIDYPDNETILDCELEDITFNKIEFSSESDYYIFSENYDSKNGLYLNTNLGYCFIPNEVISNSDNKKIENSIVPSNELKLSHSKGTHIYQDKDGIQWISTTNGVYKYFGNLNFEFKNYQEEFLKDRDVSIFTFFERNDSLTWIGTEDGLYSYNLLQDELKKIEFKDDINKSLVGVWAIEKDKQDNLWIGTINGKLFKLSKSESQNPSIQAYPTLSLEDLSTNNHIWKISNVDEAHLLIATHRGLLLYNKKDKIITSSILYGTNIFDVINTSNGYYASATSKGLIKIDIDSSRLSYSLVEGSEDSKLQDKIIFDLELDGEDIWIATMAGLEKYNLVTGRFEKEAKISETITDQVKSITCDDNNVWFSTSTGLYSYNKENKRLSYFNSFNGINDNLSLLASHKGRHSNNIYFGGSQGFNIISNSLFSSQKNHEILLTDIKISNESLIINKIDAFTKEAILTKSLKETDQICLSHKHKYVSIDFTVFDYVDPFRYNFKYSIEGFDNDWKDLENKKTISLANLPPGDYNLIIEGTNKSGEDLKSRTLKIHIDAPFWKQSWFPALATISLFLLAFLGSKYYQRAVLERNEDLEHTIKVRTQELQDKNLKLQQYIESNLKLEQFAHAASHDLQGPLRTIISFTGLLKKKLSGRLTETEGGYFSFIESGTRRLNELITDLLEFSKIESDKLNFQTINPNTLINKVITSLGASILETNAEIIIGTLPQSILVDDLKISRVIQNLIANALKFVAPGTKPHIHINCTSDKSYWLFKIQDNGIGISDDNISKIFDIFRRVGHSDIYDGTGMGLSISKKIIEAHNGELTVESTLGEGSSFIFKIPKNPENVATQ